MCNVWKEIQIIVVRRELLFGRTINGGRTVYHSLQKSANPTPNLHKVSKYLLSIVTLTILKSVLVFLSMSSFNSLYFPQRSLAYSTYIISWIPSLANRFGFIFCHGKYIHYHFLFRGSTMARPIYKCISNSLAAGLALCRHG